MLDPGTKDFQLELWDSKHPEGAGHTLDFVGTKSSFLAACTNLSC